MIHSDKDIMNIFLGETTLKFHALNNEIVRMKSSIGKN
jgi:hypothetical protein